MDYNTKKYYSTCGGHLLESLVNSVVVYKYLKSEYVYCPQKFLFILCVHMIDVYNTPICQYDINEKYNFKLFVIASFYRFIY